MFEWFLCENVNAGKVHKSDAVERFDVWTQKLHKYSRCCRKFYVVKQGLTLCCPMLHMF